MISDKIQNIINAVLILNNYVHPSMSDATCYIQSSNKRGILSYTAYPFCAFFLVRH